MAPSQKNKKNKTKIKTKNQFMLNQSHMPSATHRYTANTHTQLLVLENHKYPPSQIFG